MNGAVPAVSPGLAFQYFHHQQLDHAVLSASLLLTAARLMRLDLAHAQLPSAKQSDHDHPCSDHVGLGRFVESHEKTSMFRMSSG